MKLGSPKCDWTTSQVQTFYKKSRLFVKCPDFLKKVETFEKSKHFCKKSRLFEKSDFLQYLKASSYDVVQSHLQQGQVIIS